MTYAEAYAAIAAIAAERGDIACLRVEAWTRAAGVDWAIWSSLDGTHYTAHSAELAVERYRARSNSEAQRAAAVQAVGCVDVAALALTALHTTAVR